MCCRLGESEHIDRPTSTVHGVNDINTAVPGEGVINSKLDSDRCVGEQSR